MTDRPAVLDQQVIAELLASVGGDDAFVADLVRTYIAEGAAHMAAMDVALAASDAAAIVRPAHSLKSSSAALGAVRLSEISRDIEHAGREGRTDALAALMIEAHSAWSDTLVALQAPDWAG